MWITIEYTDLMTDMGAVMKWGKESVYIMCHTR